MSGGREKWSYLRPGFANTSWLPASQLCESAQASKPLLAVKGADLEALLSHKEGCLSQEAEVPGAAPALPKHCRTKSAAWRRIAQLEEGLEEEQGSMERPW